MVRWKRSKCVQCIWTTLVLMLQSHGSASDVLDSYRSDFYTDTFELVANQIDFEPYIGVQRGAVGTAQNRSGNAIDQSLLLAAALEGSVHAVRIARGRLRDDALVQLLSATTPKSPVTYNGNVTRIYDPINDPVQQRIVRDHAWVEIQLSEGSVWTALDPVFPNAQPGQSFAQTSRTYKTPPPSQHQRLTVTLLQETGDGRTRRLGRIQSTVAELSTAPISLVIRGIHQYEKQPEHRKSSRGTSVANPGGLLGGGLSGSNSANVKPDDEQEVTVERRQNRTLTGIEYRRELSYAGRAPEALKPLFVPFNDDGARLVREWLEFELRVPGMSTRRIERDLFLADSESSLPPAVRRYSIAVIAGVVNDAIFSNHRLQLDREIVRETKAELTRLTSHSDVNTAGQSLMQLEAAHALTPHLINLAFAYESDKLTDRLRQGAGIRVVRDVPRILITSVETQDDDGDISTQLSLDLRLDEVTAQPLDGMPLGAEVIFQRARGMQESALEGRVLARFVDQPDRVVTTTRLMDIAQRQGHELVLLTSSGPEPTDVIRGAPDIVIERITQTLANQRQVIVPKKAVRIDTRNVWGWWDVDPATGAFVGVMQSGQHQAMAQYSLTLEKVGVNDAMGYVIGALTGSTATMTLYSAKMLEYGEVTPQLIQEVASGIERLTCVTCPGVEVTVSPLSGSASFESTCFEQTGIAVGTGGGVSGSISFCENYKLGISCAASLLLGTFNVEGNVDIGPNLDLDLGPLSCD